MKIKNLKNKICSIKIKTFQSGILKRIINILKIFETQKLNNSLLIEYQTLPIQIKKFTVQRSPHGFKKAREQFELRTNTYLISIESLINLTITNNPLKESTDFLKEVKYTLNKILLKLMQLDGISIQVNSVFLKKIINFKN